MFAALLALLTPAQPADAAGYGVYPTIRTHAGAGGLTTYTTSVNLGAASWLYYETADVYAVLDLTTLQTVTLKTQSSADGVTWVDGTTIWNGVVADQATTSRINALGSQYRFVLTASGESVYTPTIKIVLK
jgi:hypothetical protein